MGSWSLRRPQKRGRGVAGPVLSFVVVVMLSTMLNRIVLYGAYEVRCYKCCGDFVDEGIAVSDRGSYCSEVCLWR